MKNNRVFPPYRQYKDSGIEWLGEIPSHWEVKRLKYVGEAIIGLTYDPINITDETDGVLVLRSSNVQGGRIVFDDNVFVKASIPEKLVTKPQDILLCSRNGSRALIGKNAMIGAEATGLTFGAFMTIFRSSSNKYLLYVFNSSLFEYQSGTFLTSTVNQLTVGNLNCFEVPMPSVEEQQFIASFLDRETAKIDTLIEKQQRLISLLTEKRQAVISHAVTKGLDPQVSMKDSGIEWLGEVPEHWEIKSLGMLAEALQTGPFGSQLHSSDYVDDATPVINPSNIQDGRIVPDWSNTLTQEVVGRLQQHVVHAGDLLVARRGELGRCAVVHDAEQGWVCGTGCIRIILKASCLPAYVSTLFSTSGLRETLLLESVGATMDNLNTSILAHLMFAIPALPEQDKILRFLDRETAKIDKLIAKANRSIDLMKERRSALISAAVTGKIDVRQVV